MKKKILDIIAVSSIISGAFITVCDYLVQMRSTETEQFVSRLLVLDGVSITLSSYVCIFAFPFWIIGLYLVYLTMHKVNSAMATICSGVIAYSMIMMTFFHYCYALIYNIGNAGIIGSEWESVVSTLSPFFPFMFILLPLGWILVGICNLSSKAIVSRWTILLNPVVLMVMSSTMTWLSPTFFRKVQPCTFSLGITSYYFICWFYIRKKI